MAMSKEKGMKLIRYVWEFHDRLQDFKDSVGDGIPEIPNAETVDLIAHALARTGQRTLRIYAMRYAKRMAKEGK